MKKLLLAGTVLMLLGTASLSYAKLGVGYDGYNSTPRYGAVSFKYWAEKYGFQGMLGFDYDGAESGRTSDVENMLVDFTAKFLFPLVKAEKLWLNGVLSLGIVYESGIEHVTDCTRMNTGFLVGLSPEYYVFDNLSFETTFGIGGTMYGKTKTGTVEDTDDYMTFETFGKEIGISTGVAFHYYFPEAASVTIEE